MALRFCLLTALFLTRASPGDPALVDDGCRFNRCVFVKAKGKSGSTWVSALVRGLLAFDAATRALDAGAGAGAAVTPAHRSKCHKDPEFGKHGLDAGAASPCGFYLVLFRDPRDIAISGFHYFARQSKARGLETVDDALMAECSNRKGVFNGQANIYRNWVLSHRLAGHVRPVFYEELLENATREVLGWVEFLELKVSPIEVGSLVDNYRMGKDPKRDEELRKKTKARAGTASQWRTKLNATTAAQCSRHINEQATNRTGLRIPLRLARLYADVGD